MIAPVEAASAALVRPLEPDLERAGERSSRPILVTGIPRCGTSWIGKILDAGGAVVYVNEPLNPKHPPGGCPGVLRAAVRRRFLYITDDNESEYLGAFRDTIGLRYHPLAELRQNHAPYDLLRLLKYWSSFTRGRRRGRRALFDDPFAVFSAPWLRRRLDCHVVAVVRHPAAIVASRKRLGYRFEFDELLRQPLLLRDWLAPFREEMEALAGGRGDLIEESCLLWRVIYGIVARQRQLVPDLLVVRYEDLARRPLDGFARLYRSLGLTMSDRVRDEIARATTSSGDSSAHAWSISRRSLSKTGFRPMDSRQNATSWRRTLSRDEVDRVRALTDDISSLFYGDDDW